MWPFSSSKEAVEPVGKTLPPADDIVAPAKPDIFSGLTVLAQKIGGLFDMGHEIYGSILGRKKADEIIQDDTREPQTVTVTHTLDVNSFFKDNKTVILLVAGSLLFFGLAITARKSLRKR